MMVSVEIFNNTRWHKQKTTHDHFKLNPSWKKNDTNNKKFKQKTNFFANLFRHYKKKKKD